MDPPVVLLALEVVDALVAGRPPDVGFRVAALLDDLHEGAASFAQRLRNGGRDVLGLMRGQAESSGRLVGDVQDMSEDGIFVDYLLSTPVSAQHRWISFLLSGWQSLVKSVEDGRTDGVPHKIFCEKALLHRNESKER
ncbi:hypothetical protein GCM10023088_26930 [Actinomadura verrucosospora]